MLNDHPVSACLHSVIVIVHPDTSVPVITLTGANPQFIKVGTVYAESGATAQDNIDGNISADIMIDISAVNTSVPGSYNVSDAAGNVAATQTRLVTQYPGLLPGETSANSLTVRGTAHAPSGVEVNGVSAILLPFISLNASFNNSGAPRKSIRIAPVLFSALQLPI